MRPSSVLAALLLLSALPASGTRGTEPSEAPSDPDEISTLLEEGRLDAAVAAGRAAVAVRPDDPELRLVLAKALASSARRLERSGGEASSPIPVETEGIRVETPTVTRVSVGYDAALYEEALLHLGEGIRRAPARADLRMVQCFLLTDGARIDRAAAAVRDAARALPRTPDLPMELARFGAERSNRGDDVGGARLLGEVVSAFPDHAGVRADQGMALARLGRAKEALAALDRAATLAPRDVRILRMRGAAAMALREFAAARAAYDAAFSASRDDADRFGAAAAAYGADPKLAAALFEELAVPAASAPQGLADLAARFAAAARSADRIRAETALAEELRAEGQELLAIPLLHRAAEAGSAGARETLSSVYVVLGMPALAGAVSRR